MKKFLSVISMIGLCAATVVGALCLMGCSRTYDVTTVDDLFAMERGKNYRLNADIDLQGREWTAIGVSSFDGGGHTIKNAVMYDGSGFFTAANVSDLTLENISVMSDNSCFGFASGEGIVKNVHIKSCTATLTASAAYNYLGAVVGRGRNVEGCTASDCIINCNVSGITSVGGIAGEGVNYIVGCATDSVTVKGKGTFMRCGGIVGFFDGSQSAEISDCRAVNNTIELSTDTAYVGGITGSSIQYVSERDSGVLGRCVSDGNTIAVTTDKSEVTIGGIVGFSSSTLHDCLSKNNTISLASNTNKGFIGGVVGATQRNMEKCIGYENTLIDVNSSGGTYCGFVARSANAMAVHCATHNVKFEGAKKKDHFSLESPDMAMYCYFDGGTNSFTDEQWLSGAAVQTALALDAEIWTTTAGELPDIIKE